ncbi:type II CAAX endopeptidase family protein [Salinilacihabitans rarus]|uniref:type II CAAX endopeptidase family protein n=1 Tax=Salinilacihabitans rarus TaxID=2961596 RepID=UPI0020C8FD9C|nr:type II CAAX endopeptidase family protein [Salinilacihabitans rarus]
MTRTDNWIADHRLLSFFALAYAISWSLNGIVIVLEMDPSWTRWIVSGFLSALGPAIAAAVVLVAAGDGLREWARGIVRWRVHPKWYAAAIGVPAAITLAAAAVAQFAGGPVDFGTFSPDVVTLGIGLVLATFLGGGQEELGWRGFAQPELQARLGATPAAVVVGILWGLWHLPLFFDPTTIHSQWSLPSQLAYFVGITGFSVLLAWVYNGSGGSILLAMLMHGAENALGSLAPVQFEEIVAGDVVDWEALTVLNVSHTLITVALALAVVAVVGRGLHASRVGRPTPDGGRSDGR